MKLEKHPQFKNRSCGIKAAALWVIAFAIQAAVAPSAQAVVTVFFQDVGSDLKVTYSGTLDVTGLTGLTTPHVTLNTTYLDAGAPGVTLINGAHDGEYRAYAGGFTTTTFGSAGGRSDGSILSSSDTFGFDTHYVYVAYSYVSGASLSGQMTFSGTSIAALGITNGVIAASWSSDSIVISTSAVPEPSTYAAIAGLAALCFVGFIRRRRVLAA